MLDGPAMSHIRLMADPCNAPLVAPAYEFPGGGAIIRYRRILTVGANGVEKHGAFGWAPGANEFYSNGADFINSNFVPSNGSMFGPLSVATGHTGFTSFQSFRCVAACAKFVTNASEANRSGLVFLGLTDTSQGWRSSGGAGVMTPEYLSGILPTSTRAPSKSAELVWTPSHADTDFTSDPVDTNTNSAGISRSVMSFAFTGAPAASGYTVECTAVYEVRFGATTGMSSPVVPPVSSTSWNNVLRGFSQLIRNAPVMIDGVRRATDYISNAGVNYLGQVGARAAVGLLM